MKKIIFAVFMIIFQIFTITVLAVENDEKLLTLTHNGNNNYFEFDISPGKTACLEFKLFNESDSSIVNNLLIYDSYTAVNGGNTIMSPEELIACRTASWFEINQEKITLAPGDSMVKKVYFTVPKSTVPGEYTAILALYSTNDKVIEQKDTGEEEVGIKLNRYYTSTLAIVLRVGKNPVRQIEFSDDASFVVEESSGRSFLYVPVINSGYTYEFPEVSVQVFDSSQQLLFNDSLTMDIVYMNSETYACFETTNSIIEAGEFKIKAIMVDSATNELLDNKEFVCGIKKDDVKKAVIQQVQNEKNQNQGWGNGFFVFDRGHIYMVGGISVTLVCVLFGLMLYKKSR